VSRYSSKPRAAAARGRGSASGYRDGTLHAALAELLALDSKAGWVVSCYQKLEPADRAGDKYRIKLKNRLRAAAERLEVLGFAHHDREAVADALVRIERFFRYPSNLAGGRGVAVFAANGFFRAVRLPYVLRSRVMVDRTPVVSELVALAEAGTRLLVVVADRRSARFFDVSLDGVTELEGLAAPDATRPKRFHGTRETPPGFGEFRFHNRIREEKQRHLARISEEVAARFRATPYEHLVIGGIGVDASALLPHLTSELRDRVLGVLRLAPRQASASEIRDRALELLAEAAQVSAAEAVGELTTLRETGWAADGVEPTLRCLARGQVRTLVVDADATIPGFRCSQSGRLTEAISTSRGEGEPIPVADLLDEAVEDALKQRARVAVVSGDSARHFDRLAGILRFRAPR
jgi:peptide chain release factor subunit 1